jgi:ligand-binding sensor domain-containing protein
MRILSLLILFFSAFQSFSQIPFFQSYSLLKKNEQIKVNVIFQDRSGFVWFGTSAGLFKYNGSSFKNFNATNGLPDNIVTALAEDSLGRIWAGHQTGELSILENEAITKFSPEEGHAKAPISDIVFDHKGRLWFSALDEGLYYFANNRLNLLDDVDGLPDKFIYDLQLDSLGRIWAGTDRGIAICSIKNDQAEIEVKNNASGLPDNIIKKIFYSKGKMWLGSEDLGLISTDMKAMSFKKELPNWEYGAVTDFAVVGNEAVVALEQTGLLLFNLKSGKTTIYNSNDDKGFLKITCLLPDREGSVWIGGAEMVRRLPGYTIEHYDRSDIYVDKNVASICIDKNETLWFSINGRLYYKTTKPDKKSEVPFLTESKWKNSFVSSLYVDSLGFIWVGFLGQGLARINPDTREVLFLEPLKNTTVLSITGDENSVWVASLSGAIRIALKSHGTVIKKFDKGSGLSTDYIYQVFIDSKKRVWFGTDGKGVDMLDASGFHHYDDGLKSKVVFGFAEDRQQRIWVNTQGDGLNQLSGSKFVSFSATTNQLRSSEINCLSADKNGNLVMLHEMGMDVYDIHKNKVFRSGEEIGLRDFSPNLNSVASDRQGVLYFGTSRGIIRYSPRAMPERTTPEPRIESLKVSGKTIFPTGSEIFRYNQNEITISYIGLWYQNAENLHYQYQLEGFDKTWIESKDHAAIYSDLPPGDYTFRLRTSDSEFFYPEEAKLTFKITPPFWRTNLFYALSILIVVLSGFFIVKFRERNLVEEKRLLEAKILERTYEIQKKNEEIQAQAEEIIGINENLEMLVRARTTELEQKNKALEEYAFITAHELRAPLASILGLVNILSKVKLEEQDKEILGHLKESSERLESIVRTITEAIEKGDAPTFVEKQGED